MRGGASFAVRCVAGRGDRYAPRSMADHVLIRPLEHLSGSPERPRLAYGFETRDRPGPAY